MCECVQDHIKTLWQCRITGNAIKAVVCMWVWARHSSLLPSDQRVCTLRGLTLCVLPSAVNSGMICHWYTVSQVNRGSIWVTRIKCQHARDGIWGLCYRHSVSGVCVCGWVFDPHYCTYALFSQCVTSQGTLCVAETRTKKGYKTPLWFTGLVDIGLLWPLSPRQLQRRL